MCEIYHRYAVGWVPAATSALARFGAEWFGWCAEIGERLTRSGLDGCSSEGRVETIGCLHAPVVPAIAGHRVARFGLEARLQRFAETTAPVAIGRVEARHSIDGVVIGPRLVQIGLARMLRECAATVLGPEPRRPHRAEAPLEQARDFRIRMTGPVSATEAEVIIALLRRQLGAELQRSHVIDELTLLGYPSRDSRPVVLQRFELTGDEAAPSEAMAMGGPRVLVDDVLLRA